MLLTILIPTIVGREAEFERLCNEIEKQATLMPHDFLKVHFLKDNKELSIGEKRQQLLNACETEWFVMIDDDDSIARDYLKKVYEALQSNPDCVTYLEAIHTNGKYTQTACHSNKYNRWANNVDGFHFVRCPFYKDVIRTSIAKQIGFKNMDYGEDSDFSLRLKQIGLIKTEHHIPELMYIYNAPAPLSREQHKKRYGIK